MYSLESCPWKCMTVGIAKRMNHRRYAAPELFPSLREESCIKPKAWSPSERQKNTECMNCEIKKALTSNLAQVTYENLHEPTTQHASMAERHIGKTQVKLGQRDVQRYSPAVKTCFLISCQNFLLSHQIHTVSFKMYNVPLETWQIRDDVHVAITSLMSPSPLSQWLFLRKDVVYRWAGGHPAEDHPDQACEYARRQPSQSV